MTAPAPQMVTLTIDGREVSVPAGTSIIEAAKLAGILIPHYCYHPGIPSAPAVCRMCLVEVEKAPKLQPSCATPVAQGMVVHVGSDSAREARQGVLEFLLINHPLDCPICDQAGECELQDFVFVEGRPSTRFAEFAKRFNPVEEFGPDVLYVPNRCILCTRCVRFMDEVAKEPVLNVSERGDRAYIGIVETEQLDHAWAGNVVDLCPVGSLISKDFLHKARVWDLDKTASICPNCTQGCNISMQTRDNQVVRLVPRPNAEVNRYFMCDHGRLGYQWLNRSDRIEAPLVRQDGRLVPVDWERAISAANALVRSVNGKPIVALVNPGASCEALEACAAVKGTGPGAFRVAQGPEAPLPGVPDLALRKDRAANVFGALEAGFTRDFDQAAKAIPGAGLVIALDETLEHVELGNTPLLYIGTVMNEVAHQAANVVLPCANMAEEEGTFRNVQGRVQAYYQAKNPPGMARSAAWILETLRTGRRAGVA